MTSLTIRIVRWLKKEEVWRYVGFVSTIVALLCYGLSSSFNSLFGEWSLLKIFLYSVFSLFICLWSLFAKVWQYSTSLRFKAHSALLVLSITSVYSYFADKAVNGKPDIYIYIYSLISCVAFAIMSLSLSRQTQCGFEVDLLYFFLACLIVLLMKIKLVLAIVGVGFSYVLIILRSSLDTTSYENLGVLDDSLVIDVNSLPTDNASMMSQLMTCIRALQQGNSNVTNMLFEHVKEYLEDNSKPVAIDSNFVIDELPSGKINDLRKTIKLVMGIGFAKECYEEYCNWRRESFKECLVNLLGLPVINMEEKSRRLEVEDYILRRRIDAIEVALGTLIPSERRLCDSVFEGFSSVAHLCFTDVCQGASIQLLNIAVMFASGSPSYWRLFEIVGMFEAWSDLIPEFQSLFPESLVKKAMAIHDEVGEASRDIFMKAINMIFHTPEAKIMVRTMNDRVHVLTINVMSYLIGLADRTLEHNGAGTSSLSVQIDRIMKHLDRKLVAESKNLGTRRYLFMMNNWRLVELCAEKSGLDVDCFKKYTTKIQQYLKHYQRSFWNVVLDLLKLENDDQFVEPNAKAESMKFKLILFNNNFKNLCSNQSRWVAFDMQLREQIIMSLENILLPAYGNFIGRFQNILGKHAYEYIKYGMFDIQDQINHLFLGSKPMDQYQKMSERLLMICNQTICSSKKIHDL